MNGGTYSIKTPPRNGRIYSKTSSPAPQTGVTRDRKRVRCEWNGVAFELLDTGGIDLADEDELARDIQRQARIGMAEADVVMLVADARAGVRAGDAELAKTLRGAEVPVLVAANKVDRPDARRKLA